MNNQTGLLLMDLCWKKLKHKGGWASLQAKTAGIENPDFGMRTGERGMGWKNIISIYWKTKGSHFEPICLF